MSYEGYEQHICKSGHRFDTYDIYSLEEASCFCGEKSAYMNSVDQTNGGDVGFITQESFNTLLVSPTKTETCACCGHTKQLEPAVYRIPTKSEMSKYRTISIFGADGECQIISLEEYDSQGD